MRGILGLLGALTLAACPSPASGPDASTAMDASGVDAGPAWERAVLDPSAQGSYPISLAVNGGKIGVAYFVDVAAGSVELRYVEQGGAPEVVATVTRVFGASLAFDPSGGPHIAYLGKPGYGTFWTESAPNLASRAGGTWTSEVVQQVANNALGLYPALAIDATGQFFLAYRNVKSAQTDTQGGKESDLDFSFGHPGAWTHEVVAQGMAGGLNGYGGYNRIVLAGDPALAWTGLPDGAGGQPSGVWFAQKSGGQWSSPSELRPSVSPTNGPSLAFSQSRGLAVAFEDQGSIMVSTRPAGGDWNAAGLDERVDGSSKAMFPSVAATEELVAVAYYQCAPTRTAQTCSTDYDEVTLTWLPRAEAGWRVQTVDPAGGHYLELAYLNGKAVIAYKDLADHVLQLALQR
jgi:hypothetical protein